MNEACGPLALGNRLLSKVFTLALTLALFASPALAAHRAEVQVEMIGDEKKEVLELEVITEGNSGLIRLLKSSMAGAKPGTYLVTRDAGLSWHIFGPRQAKCSQWKTEDLAAVVGGFLNKLGNWADLRLVEPKISKILEEKGKPLLGYATRHHRFEISFTLKASFLFRDYKYRVIRLIDLWSTSELSATTLTNWLQELPIRTGHKHFDILTAEGVNKVRGVILKERLLETVIDIDGKVTKTDLREQVTRLEKTNTPEVFKNHYVLPKCKQLTRDDLGDHVKPLIDK